MTTATEYPLLQELRIGAVHHHLHVVIGFDHQIVGMRDALTDLICYRTDVCDDDKGDTFGLYLVTHIVSGIMRNMERPYLEITKLERLIGCNIALQVIGHLLDDTIILVDT